MSLMSWLTRPFGRDREARRTIEAIYGMIVTQARLPEFYADLGVPDTVSGRFDLVVLHLWIVLYRLRAIEAAGDLSKNLAQGLFDRFCDDMDANLREMGVGDLTVPKRMQSFGEAFYGRVAAYDAALEAADPRAGLAAAFGRNILGEPAAEASAADAPASRIARYALDAIGALAGRSDAAVLAQDWSFPPPTGSTRG